MTKPSPDIASIAEELRGAVSAFVRTVRSETDTPRSAQSDTLEWLERDGPTSIAALAQKRNVKHQSMRLVTGILEEEGLIKRSDHGEDLRSYLFTITPKGRKSLQKGREKRTARISEMIHARLTRADHQDLLRAAELLRQLVDNEDTPDV